MIIVKLQGGLGNQMFQYAAAEGIKRDNESIFLDLNFLRKNNQPKENFAVRSYELNLFPNIKSPLLSPYKSKILNGSSKISKTLKKLKIIAHDIILQADNDHSIIDTSSNSHIRYLDGYFQSETYFKHVKKEIIEKFAFPNLVEKNAEIKKQILNSENSVSIHIRRGDYVGNPLAFNYHGILDLAYYRKAIEHLTTQLVTKLNLFIFTDDIEWAKRNLNFENMFFVEGNTEKNSWKDMALMSYCKHHIIANSSFSWWGAWLSQRGGIKYAPKNWFSKHIDYNIHDIVPSNWIIIE